MAARQGWPALFALDERCASPPLRPAHSTAKSLLPLPLPLLPLPLPPPPPLPPLLPLLLLPLPLPLPLPLLLLPLLPLPLPLLPSGHFRSAVRELRPAHTRRRLRAQTRRSSFGRSSRRGCGWSR
jgi:hypothetical protein